MCMSIATQNQNINKRFLMRHILHFYGNKIKCKYVQHKMLQRGLSDFTVLRKVIPSHKFKVINVYKTRLACVV